MGWAFVVLACVAAIWAMAIVAWRWTLLRLDLAGPDAVQRGALHPRERRAHRSLRALLAFDFLVLYPVALPLAVVAFVSGNLDVGVLLVLGVAVLSIPLASLTRVVRELRCERLAGTPLEPRPSLWIDEPEAVLAAAWRGRNRHALAAIALWGSGGACVLASLVRERPGDVALLIGLVLAAAGAAVHEIGERRARR